MSSYNISAMVLLFVNWWPEDHFEYNWHLNPEQVALLARRGIELRRVTGYAWNEPWTWKFLVGRVRFIRDLLRKANEVDVVVTHMDSFPSRIVGLGRSLRVIRRPKLVMVDYWLHPSTPRFSLRRVAKELVIRHVYGKFDLVLFDTLPGEREFREEGYLGRGARTAFLPISLSTAKRQHLAEERARVEGSSRTFEGPYYFAAGNSNRDYNTLFVAAALLPQIRFVVMSSRLPDDLATPDNVILAEWGLYSEYLEILGNARAAVIPMPPGVEAAGLRTLFEAWAMKVPTIVADCDGVRSYVLNDAGDPAAFLYKAGDADSLAAVVSSLERNVCQCDAVVERAAARLTDEFSSDAYIERLVPHLMSTASG